MAFTLKPLHIALLVIARIAAFIPGASPPEVNTPMHLILAIYIGYIVNGFNLSGRRGSNSRPWAWEAHALPTELLPHSLCSFKCEFTLFYENEKIYPKFFLSFSVKKYIFCVVMDILCSWCSFPNWTVKFWRSFPLMKKFNFLKSPPLVHGTSLHNSQHEALLSLIYRETPRSLVRILCPLNELFHNLLHCLLRKELLQD